MRQRYGKIVSVKGTQQVALSEYRGLLIREQAGYPFDREIVNEFETVYRDYMGHVVGQRVLDIGAHIGVFSLRALENGASRVMCIEPEDGAFSVLIENLGHRPWCRLIPAAVGAETGTATLAVQATGNSYSASTVYRPAYREHRAVPQIAFGDALAASSAQVLKVDCEGAELDFLDGRKLPPTVHTVFAEFHRWDGMEPRAREAIATFGEWNELHPLKPNAGEFCWVGSWTRY